MELIEREHQLAMLRQSFELALGGHGHLALVHGEAGVGKTSLVQCFLRTVPASVARLLMGCEALFAPRPLGPLLDLLDTLPPGLAGSLREGRANLGLFSDFLSFLRRPPVPKVLFIDDLHWADETTLDLVRYVGRRLDGLPVLLILSCRDDDLGATHPVRVLLGELPAAATLRVPVPCLSESAVEDMARRAHRHRAGLFATTGGNPFYVAEVLNAQGAALPPSVYDAVLARLSRVSGRARAAAEIVSVSPQRLERSIVEALLADAAPALDECVAKGLLANAGDVLAFRHDIARQAVEQSLLPGRRIELHRHLFERLSSGAGAQEHAARRVHHAQLAGLAQAVADLAPQAARAAAAASSHREAARLYALAIRHAEQLDPADRANVLEDATEELRLVGDAGAALEATRAALRIRVQQGDALRAGMNLRRIAGTLWREKGDRAGAEAAIRDAINALHRCEPSIELARAYAELSRLLSAWSDYDDSIRVSEQALALAETLDDAGCLVEALHVTAAARMALHNDVAARRQLERALEIALREKLEDAAAGLFVTLQIVSLNHRDHAYALNAATRGIAYCEARDLDGPRVRMLITRVLSLIDLGRWQEADEEMERCLSGEAIGRSLRNSLLFIRERQAARRGASSSEAYWSTLQRELGGMPTMFRLPAIAAACAEAAWLRGDLDAARRVICSGLANAVQRNEMRLLGALLVWARRCGMRAQRAARPTLAAHAEELTGDIGAAAQAWAGLDCRYERALSLVHGNEAQIREALTEFDALGATAAAQIARTRLRALGARSIQRGPRPHTRSDPLGLTARERQIHDLLLRSLSNAQIAQRLHRSERTVEHHVASVLAKLGARSRGELVERAASAARGDQPIDVATRVAPPGEERLRPRANVPLRHLNSGTEERQFT